MKSLVAKKVDHALLSDISIMNHTSYSSGSTLQGIATTHNEFLDFALYEISCDMLFGIRSTKVEKSNLDVEYTIQLNLSDFGLPNGEDSDLAVEANSKLNFDVHEKIKFVFTPGKLLDCAN